MKLIPLIFALLIVLCQIAPAIAVNSKEVTVEETTKLEVKEASKDKVTVKEFTSTASGDSKVKSKDISLKTEKLDKSLKISSTTQTKSKSVDSHDILIPIADVPNFNGHSVRVDHYTDAGVMDYQYVQEVAVEDGYIVLQDVEFSSVIVDGATGISSTTYTNYNVTDNSFIASHTADRMVIEILGVDDGVEIDENNSSTYPSSLLYGYGFNGNGQDVLGTNNGTVHEYCTYTAGVVGQAIKFANIDSNQDPVALNQTISFSNNTVSFWAQVYPGDYQGIFSENIGAYGYFRFGAGASTETSTLIGETETDGDIISFSYDDVGYYTWNHYIIENNGNSWNLYINNELVDSDTTSNNIVNINNIGNGRGTGDYSNSSFDSIMFFDGELSISEKTRLYTGYSGTSISPSTTSTWTHIQNNTATIYNVSEDDVFNVLTPTETTASEFTVTYYYTEDTTLETEVEEDGVVEISINYTPSQNYSVAYLNYTPATSNFTYNLSMVSTDSNATAITHDQIINISTSGLQAGVNYWYNITLSSLESFNYTTNWISKTSTKAVVEYNSTNSNVENDFYLTNMSASSTFDFKYSNGTILTNATSDSNGYLKFDDVGGVTDSYKLINDTYTIEKQSSTVSFVAVVFTGLSFVGLYFVNRFRRR